ncbi:MAG TPA: 2-C-methyl-D-erythritol 2,4-cyclodiphosphate synthase [Firmicutes bacterium]|nr:2-C-methyl-D-erythritol 2,4-cyclodiphosphate synthase [Bacillota bacterium]
MRIGIGFDIHRFEKGRKFILGGIEIPFEKGLAGHSDGDVLIHSLSDAILGALGKPDIGYYFPDTDEKIKGIDSTQILKKVLSIMKKERCKIENIDIVIICEKPKLSPYIPSIKKRISEITGIEEGKIGIKAKTYEKIGEIGRGNACACLSSVLLVSSSE